MEFRVFSCVRRAMREANHALNAINQLATPNWVEPIAKHVNLSIITSLLELVKAAIGETFKCTCMKNEDKQSFVKLKVSSILIACDAR